jgi:hypothetical protein
MRRLGFGLAATPRDGSNDCEGETSKVRRSLIRSLGVLVVILVLVLAAAAPATAGSLSGSGTFPPQLGQPGECAFTQNPTTLHFFVAHATGSTNHQIDNPGKQMTDAIQPNVIIIGPLASLPADVANSCTSVPF